MENEERVEYLTIQENPNAISVYVSEQFTSLGSLKEKVIYSKDKAERAQKSAKEASEKSAKFGHHTDTIESLQIAVADQSQAQIATNEAQELSLKYQETLADTVKKLLTLGITSVASTRNVIKELEFKLNNASQEEIDEATKNEIINLIRQLKVQEDIWNKLDRLSKITHTHDDELQQYKKKITELDGHISAQKGQITLLEQKYGDLQSQNDSLSQILAKKSSRTTGIISTIIGVLGLISAIVGFFL